jgi:trehalose 6-phosphate phosphatase
VKKHLTRLLLLLDFDGTLSPIVDDPARASLPVAFHHALRELIRVRGVSIAIISGRRIDFLRRRVRLRVIYAGNHGLRIQGPGLLFEAPLARQARPLMGRLAVEIRRKIARIRGATVDNNGFTLSVHFRNVSTHQAGAVARIARSVCHRYTDRVELRSAKKHVEIRPKIPWNKGAAALWIREHLKCPHIICVGDDATDEDMFRALPGAITVKVGQGTTAARYRCHDPASVLAFLRMLRRELAPAA